MWFTRGLVDNASTPRAFPCLACRQFAKWCCDSPVCVLRHARLQILNTRYEEAAPIFHENCKLRHHGTSCFHLGVLHTAQRIKGATYEKAAEYFDASCEYGNKDGCYAAAKAGFQSEGTTRNGPKILGPLCRCRGRGMSFRH